MFSVTRSRLRVENSRSRPKTGWLRNPALNTINLSTWFLFHQTRAARNSPIGSTLILSRSSQSHFFLGSYANMHVYERKKLLIQENVIKICVYRELEPATSRLWGKGVSTRLVRMDQFMHNLGLVLCNSTDATCRWIHKFDHQKLTRSEKYYDAFHENERVTGMTRNGDDWKKSKVRRRLSVNKTNDAVTLMRR